MKQLHLIGNLKMNLSKALLTDYFEQLKLVANATERTVGVCVPSVYLPLAQEHLQGSKVLYGVQNVWHAESGAFTGEISTNMVKDYNGTLVIVGHSERRHVFGETDNTINLKLQKVISKDLTPIFCVGETLDQRNQNYTNQVLSEQLQLGLQNISEESLANMYFAYEPVWAIGTGVSASSEDAENAIKFIKQYISQLYGKPNLKLTVLYGGSLNETNASNLLSCENIDGGLIGGASLQVDSFEKIINANLE